MTAFYSLTKFPNEEALQVQPWEVFQPAVINSYIPIFGGKRGEYVVEWTTPDNATYREVLIQPVLDQEPSAEAIKIAGQLCDGTYPH